LEKLLREINKSRANFWVGSRKKRGRETRASIALELALK